MAVRAATALRCISCVLVRENKVSFELFDLCRVTCVQYLFETVLGLFTMFNPLSKSRKLWAAVPELLGGCKYGEHDSGAPLAEHLFLFLSI